MLGVTEQQAARELSFHAIAGMGIARLYKILRSDSCKFRQRVFIVVEETSRTLAYYFMRASEGKPRVESGKPFLMDMVIPRTSPVVCVLQYLSGLLAGGPGMARIIWQFHGHRDPSVWAAACKGDVRLFRRAVLLQAAKTMRRTSHLLSGPFSWVALVDDRASAEYKAQVLDEYNSTPLCCHRPGLAQTMKKTKPHMSQAEAESQRWLFPFATSVTMSLSLEERKHSHDRHFCVSSGEPSWEQFVAQSVLHQASCILRSTKQYREKCDQRQQQLTPPPPPALFDTSSSPPSVQAALAPARSSTRPRSVTTAPTASRPKARSTKELFKADFIESLKAQGEKVNVASDKFWKAFNQAWLSLAPDRLKMYERMAESEKSVALYARLELKQKKRAGEAALVPRAPTACDHGGQALVPQCSSGGTGGVVGKGFGDSSLGTVSTVLVGRASPSSDLSLCCSTSSPSLPAHPLLPDILNSYLEDERLATIKSTFTGKANRVQQECPRCIPAEADYGHQCRGLCEHTTPQLQLAMQNLLFEAWSSRFRRLESGNIMMVAEVYSGGNVVEVAGTHFFVLVGAACKYGRHPARQEFLMMDVVSEGPCRQGPCRYKDYVLKPRRKARHLPHPSMPRSFAKFFEGALGELDIITEEIVSAIGANGVRRGCSEATASLGHLGRSKQKHAKASRCKQKLAKASRSKQKQAKAS